MATIAFDELEPWEKDYVKKKLAKHTLIFIDETLSAKNIGKAKGADTAVGRRQKTLPERRGMDAIPDREAFTLPLILTGRDGFAGDKKIVQSTDPRQAGIVGDFQQTARIAEQGFGVFLGDELEETLGTGAGPALEEALEMKRTEVDMPGNLVECGTAPVVLLEKLERALDSGVIQCGL